MRIVILDGFTLNPGDLDWSPLAALGELHVYERTPQSEIVARAANAEIVLTNKTPLDRATLAQLPKLRFIGVLATGHNVVDGVAARERGVPVANVPGYGTESVAQHVWALLLELTNHVGSHAETVRQGDWTHCPDFCYWRSPLVELSGKTFGVIGWGAIGGAVARIAVAFGMQVLCHSRTAKPGVENVDLPTLLRRADVVSLHCPLTPETQGIINAARLAEMKRSAFLLNTSRGPLVVEQDLADALNEERIAGAGVDVLSIEPPSRHNPLLTARNCLITPHLAWATQAARRRLLNAVVENTRAFLAGTPQNIVNG